MNNKPSPARKVLGVALFIALAAAWWKRGALFLFLINLPYMGMPEDPWTEDAIGAFNKEFGRLPTLHELQALENDPPLNTVVVSAYVPFERDAYAFIYPGQYAKIRLLVSDRITQTQKIHLRQGDTNTVHSTYRMMSESSLAKKFCQPRTVACFGSRRKWLSPNVGHENVRRSQMAAPQICTAKAQTYVVTSRDLDFRSFHLIGQTLNQHAATLRDRLEASGVQILGPMETIYTFHDDPNGPDIPDGKFTIEVGFPVPEGANPPDGYVVTAKPAYRYISHQKEYPPYDFGWDTLRDAAETSDLKRTLEERDIHLRLTYLGDDASMMECRVVVE